MPMFLADHTWKKEQTPSIMKGLVASFMGLAAGVRPEQWPKTVNLCATYALAGECRAICIWEADKAETLVNMFKKMEATFPVKTIITPIAQVYPPGPGLYAWIAQM